MKKIRISLIIIAILAMSVILSACSGAGVNTSWPGVTVAGNGETVYISFNQHVYAVSLGNGAEQWRFPQKADNKITFFAPAAESPDGQLLVGGYDFVFYSLNPANGQQNWTFEESTTQYIGQAAASETQVLAPSSDNHLYTLDPQGRLLWKFESDHALWATPAVDGQVIYLASMDHRLYALNSDTGAIIWTSEDLGGALPAGPVLGPDGLLYVGTLGSELVALEAETGKILWRVPAEGWIMSAPHLADGVLYYGTLAGEVFAVDASGGSVRWRIQPSTEANAEITGAPLLHNDTLYFGSKAGMFYAVEAATGNQVWSKQLDGQLYASPVAAGDTILIAPVQADAILLALDASGNQKWAFTPAK